MLCTTSCAELTNMPMILRYQRIELERQRCCMAPASGRGAQWSACIKTMSVCFTRKINEFFDAWSVSRPIFCVERAEILPPCRLSCESDRPAVEGVYSMHRGFSGKQVTRRSSVCKPKRLATTIVLLLERHACHHVSLSRSPRVREESNHQHAYPLLLCIVQRL
jgi:hypothetical protein